MDERMQFVARRLAGEPMAETPRPHASSSQGTPLSLRQRPNELWCTDYKGEFLLGNRQYCYPLTVTEHASRFLLTCEALSSTIRPAGTAASRT